MSQHNVYVVLWQKPKVGMEMVGAGYSLHDSITGAGSGTTLAHFIDAHIESVKDDPEQADAFPLGEAYQSNVDEATYLKLRAADGHLRVLEGEPPARLELAKKTAKG